MLINNIVLPIFALFLEPCQHYFGKLVGAMLAPFSSQRGINFRPRSAPFRRCLVLLIIYEDQDPFWAPSNSMLEGLGINLLSFLEGLETHLAIFGRH